MSRGARLRRRLILHRLYLRLCRTPLSPNFLYFFPLYRRVTAKIEELCRGVVLDVGSGFSPFARVIDGRASYYFSLDYPSSSELAPYEALPESRRAHVWADARAMPVKSDSCDVVICTSVLEHVPEPAAVLSEVFRVLRTGGCVIGSVPFGHALHMEPYDYFRISSYGLVWMAEATGFRTVSVEPLGRGIHALAACAGDMLIRNVAGLRTGTVVSMALYGLLGRALLLLLMYPLVLLGNTLAPLVDRMLPTVSLPVHYVFVFGK